MKKNEKSGAAPFRPRRFGYDQVPCPIEIAAPGGKPFGGGRSIRLKRRDPGLGHRMILLTRAAAHADGAHNPAIALERNASRKDHNPPVVGRVYAEELPSRLTVFSQVLGGDI